MLDFDVQFNWQPRPQNEFVFTDGHRTYKVYLAVRGIVEIVPVNPNLK